MTGIQYVDLTSQWFEEREEIQPIIEKVFASGLYIGGPEIEKFEEEAAFALGVKHVIGLNSGTDALVFGLSAVGVCQGSEVITPPNSFIASTAAIVHLGAKPVFADVDKDQNIKVESIEAAITGRTRAIMPVHLTGRMADMKAICELADRHDIPVVEDAAQAIGSLLHGRSAGSWGHVGCFSAHPLKNLNACGDAGFISTNDAEVAKKIKLQRNHGLINREIVENFGHVSRMDTIQAAILSFRLSRLSDVIRRRQENADLYRSILNRKYAFWPEDESTRKNSWHTFVIQVDQRDELRAELARRAIETAIHYPIPIHLQPAASRLGYHEGDFPCAEYQARRIITLPIHQFLDETDVKNISGAINDFFASNAYRN